MYNTEFDNEDTAYTSSWTIIIIREASPPHDQDEEMNSSLTTVKISSERHCLNDSVVPEPEGHSSYNIEEVFGSFTFDLHWRDVS